MFGRSRPGSFQLYGKRRSRWRPPRWLVLLAVGMGLGAAGVIVVQERYLPPRLSASASTALQAAYTEADAERQRLRTADEERAQLAQALDRSRVAEEALRLDLALAVGALPPDPRGGAVELRAWRFETRQGRLDYEVLLTRDGPNEPPTPGVVQLTVAGESAGGGASTLTPEPITLSLGTHRVVRGRLPLPAGMQARQVTVQVLDRAGGKALGTRVFYVRQ